MTLNKSTPLFERAQNEAATDDDINPGAPPKRRTFTAEQKLTNLVAYDETTGPRSRAPISGRRGSTVPTSLPDNDPFTGGVDAITIDQAVTEILEGIESGSHAVYAPEYFPELALARAQDLDGFLARSAAYVRDWTGREPDPRK